MTDDKPDAIDPADPPAPLPETGKEGAQGEQGSPTGVGGDGGRGGRGGRGGLGLRGERGPQGKPGKTVTVEQPIMRVIGETGATGETGERGAPGDKQTALEKWGLAIVVAATALSAIYFSVNAQHRLNDSEDSRHHLATEQAAYGEQITCAQNLLHSTIVALKARSEFAETQAKVTLQLDRAQLVYLTLIVEPGATPQEQVDALATYRQALGFKIKATSEQLRIRNLQPFPTLAQVETCKG